MGKTPKPWLRAGNKTYYIEVGGRQINLGKDKRKAEAECRRLMRAYTGAAEGCTVHQLLDDYEVWMRANRAASHYNSRKYFLRGFRAAIAEQLRAEDLRPWQVETYLDTTGNKSPSSKRGMIAFLSGIYNWGCKYGLISENPIRTMPRPAARVRQNFLPPERFSELFSYVTNAALHDFLLVQLESGARAMEMFGMAAEHLRDDKFVFLIEDSKGNKRSRVIYLPRRALAVVKRLAKQHPDGKLFRNSRGRPWTKDAINDAMKKLKVKMKMPDLCSTMLRHSYAHYRLTQGQDALTVAKLMGHVDTDMLAKRYGHLEGSKFLSEKADELQMPLDESDHAA